MRFKVLLGVLIGAFSIYNVITLYDTFLPHSSFLSLANIALAGGETGSGTGSGEGGTGGGSTAPTPPSTCTSRGGSEMPKKVLQVRRCFLQASIGGTGVSGKWGTRCACESAPSGYAGQYGCNLTWETACQ